ncbi:MAG: 16S rRNA (guanine(527)-N(7))-methyltransferase RsmG [Granulosicoccus sp.]
MSVSQSLKDQLDRGLDALAAMGLAGIDQSTRGQLLGFVGLLAKWNRVYNLTAVRDPQEMVTRHLLDSLVLSPWLPGAATNPADVSDRTDVLDIGTGAGLPVLPLAIVHPELSFKSVESNGKKARFQQQALLELGLANVQIEQKRIEDVNAQARFVTSRAFTAPVDFLRIAEPLCAKNGLVAIMLGLAERLPDALPEPFVLQQLVKVDVPNTESARHVALCRRSEPL